MGRYQVTVTASGFESSILHDLSVTAGDETAANVVFKVATAEALVEVNRLGDQERMPQPAHR